MATLSRGKPVRDRHQLAPAANYLSNILTATNQTAGQIALWRVISAAVKKR
jgi:hypothetical protein